MQASLSTGSITEIMNGKRVVSPVLQLLALKKLAAPGANGVSSERYRLLLSDGVNSCTFAMLATQLNFHITNGDLGEFAIIQMVNYVLNRPQLNKKVLVVLDLVILNSGAEVGSQIGSPVCFGTSSNQENQDANPQDSNVGKNTIIDINGIHQLSTGSLEEIINGKRVASPVLQLLAFKTAALPFANDGISERYRLLLSDGVNCFTFVVLDAKMNFNIINGDLDTFAIIQMVNYVLYRPQPNKKVLVVLDLVILNSGAEVGSRIGSPVCLETLSYLENLDANPQDSNDGKNTATIITGIYQLSTGSLEKIMNRKRVDSPVLQLLALKKLVVPGANGVSSERYRLLLSDGVNSCTFAMLATQLNFHITNGDLDKFAIIRLDNYVLNRPQPNKKVLVVLDLVILNSGAEVGSQIGSPVCLETLSYLENLDANPQDSNDGKNTATIITGIYQLSTGSLEEIMNGKRVDSPVLQLLALKKLVVPGANGVSSERYRLLLSDGVNSCTFAMLATQLNFHITNGDLDKFVIIRMDNYVLNRPQPNKKVLVVLELVILNSGAEVGSQIGNPVAIGCSSNQESQDANPQHSQDVNGRVAAKQRKIHSIKNLTTSENGWTIRVRVINKTPFRNRSNPWCEIKFFTVELLDESGEIYAVCFSDNCAQFYDKLVISKLYYISNANVRPADRIFSPNTHRYEITFKAETLVEPCEDVVTEIPFINLVASVPISELFKMEINTLTNVIGVCKRYSELQVQACRSVNQEANKRDIYLVDKSNIEIALTIWDEDAERFDGSDNPIVAAKAVRISDIGGCSLCTTPLTMFLINPVTKEANELREWFASESSNSATNFTSKICSDVFPSDWKCLQQAKLDFLAGLDKAEFFTVKAVVDYTKVDYSMLMSCPTAKCNNKVVDLGNHYYRCENCNREFDSYKLHFPLDVKISDCSDSIWITCFEECSNVISKFAPEGFSDQNVSYQAFANTICKTNFKPFIFKLRITKEKFLGKIYLKVFAVSITPVKFLDYNKKLIEDLKDYQSGLHLCKGVETLKIEA